MIWFLFLSPNRPSEQTNQKINKCYIILFNYTTFNLPGHAKCQHQPERQSPEFINALSSLSVNKSLRYRPTKTLSNSIWFLGPPQKSVCNTLTLASTHTYLMNKTT